MKRTVVALQLPRTVGGLCALALAACAGPAELRPAQDAQLFRDTAAFSSAQGVLLRAEGDWKGELDVRAHATPVHVTVVNNGPHTLRLSYANLSLLGPNRRFAAVAPHSIRGTLWERDYTDTAMFPFLGAPRMWPDFGVLGAQDHDRYRPIQLPTPHMLDVALEPTMLRPSAVASGYVYFERIPSSEARVLLNLELITHDGRRLGAVRIPFRVE